MTNGHAISFSAFGDGTPLVIVHGGWLDRHHMIETLEPVFERHPGYRRLYPDMPGHGLSPPDGTENYQDVLDRLAAFVEAEAPDGPILFAGESRGGYFARALAQRFLSRVAGLLLIVPAREPHPPEDSLPLPEVRIPAPAGTRDRLPEAQRDRFDRLAVQSVEIMERVARTKLPALGRTDREHQAIVEAEPWFDPDPDLAAAPVTAPTLILLGRQDSVAGYLPMLGRIETYPHASVALLDCASHSLPFERPALFEALVSDWLDRVRHAVP